MEKKTFNFREAYERIDVIKSRLNEMAVGLENDKEREAFTEAEEGERKQLFREMDILEMKIKANTPSFEVQRQEDVKSANRQIREAIEAGKRFEVKISRDVDSNFHGNSSTYGTAGLGGTNPFGLTTHDVVEPLYNKTILAAIGSPLLTGLKGNHQWPVVEAFYASVNDEGAALGDTAIPLSKLIAKPERIGIAVPITREALAETEDLLQVIVRQYMPQAAAALMNKIMFSAAKVTNATNLYGPFITGNMTASNKLTYTGATPTLTELVNLKNAVLSKNIIGDGLCYVMNESTKSLLEATPKWSGAAAPIVENGKINGVPVFTTNEVPDGIVHFGAFKYAPQGLFGEMSIIVDPYSQARKNAIDFVLNADYAITILRQEAFASLVKVGVSLDKATATVTAAAGDNHTAKLKATVYPIGSTVTWASSATGKATVAAGTDTTEGTVTGAASGSANITASITYNGETYTSSACAVTVS